ncbi:MAG: nuclear transport factor 2 family protein [Mycobacterium sp.]
MHLDTLNSFYEAEQRYVSAGGAPAGADFGEVAAHFHADVVVRQGPTVPFGGDWHGIDAIERFFALFTETWSSLKLSDIQSFEGETGVATSMRMQATARSTGKPLDTRVGHFYTFADGLIREITVFYLDPVGVTEATVH